MRGHAIRCGALTGAALLLAAVLTGTTSRTALAAAAPNVAPGQRSVAVVQDVRYGNGVATVAPAPFPRAPAAGDVLVCAISYSDLLRGRPGGPPGGWVGPYTPGGQDATQGHLRANDTPGQYLYYHVVREGESGAIPPFSAAMTRGADPPSMGYDCVEVRNVSTRHPIRSVEYVDVSGDTFRLPARSRSDADRSVHLFYAFNQPVSSVEEGTHQSAAAAASRLAVAAAPEPAAGEERTERAVRLRVQTGATPVRGSALMVAFNPPSAADGDYFSQVPEWADRFADGAAAMNIRCDQGIYDGCDDTVVTALKNLGIRHVSGIYPAYLGKPALLDRIRLLSADGIDTLAGINPCDNDATIASLLSIPGVKYGGVTYPNEIDLAKPIELACRRTGLDDYGTWQNWWSKRAPQVYADFRHDARGVPILSQSFGGSLAHYCAPGQSQSDPDCSGIGDTTPYQDIVNIHQYAGGHHPLGATGNAHEHCGKTGTLFNFTCYATFANPAGNQPRWFGERGYNDLYVPESVIATYLPVDEMVQRLSGFTRYYFFNLVDGPSGFASTGLMTARPEFRPKPQFYALQSLIQALSDKGPAYTPTEPLDYKLTGATSSDFHYLLQFRNGRYAFLIAHVVPLWDVEGRAPLAAGSQEVTMSFPQSPHNVEIYQYDTNANDPPPGRNGCETPSNRPTRFCWSPPQHLPVNRNADGSYSIAYRVLPAMSIVFFDPAR